MNRQACRHVLLVIVLACVWPMRPGAQAGDAGRRFEVASVKPSRAVEHGGGSSGLQSGGRFVMTNGPVRVLLNRAYPTPTNEIVGAPGWVTYENYDVDARAGHDVPLNELAPLMRNLLADRFKLRAHLEMMVRPIYELRAAHEGKIGPNMRPSTVDCGARRGACSTQGGDGVIESNGTSMMAFATWLPYRVGRPVIDKTGLSGDYALRLEYSTAAADGKASLPTALREQLGLTLTAVDAPTEVLVIEHIERPDPD